MFVESVSVYGATIWMLNMHRHRHDVGFHWKLTDCKRLKVLSFGTTNNSTKFILLRIIIFAVVEK